MFVDCRSLGRIAARRLSQWALAATMLVGATGCSTPPRVVPSTDVGEGQVLAASHRRPSSKRLADESFSLGPFAVTDVKRSPEHYRSNPRQTLSRIGGKDFGWFESWTDRGYSYTFSEGRRSMTAMCESTSHLKGRAFGDSSSSTRRDRLRCTCGPGSRAPRFSLEMQSKPGRRAGEMKLSRRVVDMTIARSQGNGLPVFRAYQDGRLLAVVEVLHPGRVWLSSTLGAAERREVACLVTGLLLYVDPANR